MEDNTMPKAYNADTDQSAFMHAINSQLQDKTKRQEAAQLRLYNLTKLSLFLVSCISFLILVCYDLQAGTPGNASNITVSRDTQSLSLASSHINNNTNTNKHLIEHLQNIRMHNVTRNITDEPATTANQITANQITANPSQHISKKQAQVKAWENAFTSN